ncbi:hypothetical protein [Methylobacterium sp. Leaf100]|uniref:hypothetical protein n=1 Tax=Methylobacterium sp. Leaf100 TaxID=1736252 RepID=UPI0006FD8E4E|nr:hypothetical protein [Methylobacterium sp. Leaf100]KQP36678.1 hypothetical protein ASF25_01605 [Methylobacterium sp. Leaf100]
MPYRRLSDEHYDEIASRREAGESLSTIARAFGCSSSNIYLICLRLGADLPNAKPLPSGVRGPLVIERNGHTVRRFCADEDARLLALEAQGLGTGAIGKAMGRHPNSIRVRLMTLARREARSEAA